MVKLALSAILINLNTSTFNQYRSGNEGKKANSCVFDFFVWSQIERQEQHQQRQCSAINQSDPRGKQYDKIVSYMQQLKTI